jgi:hypothetical protein
MVGEEFKGIYSTKKNFVTVSLATGLVFPIAPGFTSKYFRVVMNLRL